MSVKENILEIKEAIPQHVTLVAVSKTKPKELILEAYETGHRDFGENYVQELVDKHEQLPKDIRWHFIGHLQSNKVKYIVPFVHLIHGVDSFKLLKEINKQAMKVNRVVNCLLQMFIAREETKFGLDFSECEAILNSTELKDLKNVNVIGFMAMASNTDDENVVKKEFESLKLFAGKMRQENNQLTVLSFGMSNDYMLAIESGSTMIRVGSSIFGNRIYTT
jgi:pyridoxal phosphate enzyme (YggS family)